MPPIAWHVRQSLSTSTKAEQSTVRNTAGTQAPTRQIWRWPAITAVVVVVLDQTVKAWIWHTMGPTANTDRPLLGPWLHLTLVKNTGVAFGMFQRYPQLFTVTSVVICLGALYFYRYHLPNRQHLIQVCLGMILGGAIGNIIDRLRYGFVIDFVNVRWFPGIFNVADSAITVGVIILAVYLLLKGEERPARPKPADDALLGDLLNHDHWPQSGDGRRDA